MSRTSIAEIVLERKPTILDQHRLGDPTIYKMAHAYDCEIECSCGEAFYGYAKSRGEAEEIARYAHLEHLHTVAEHMRRCPSDVAVLA